MNEKPISTNARCPNSRAGDILQLATEAFGTHGYAGDGSDGGSGPLGADRHPEGEPLSPNLPVQRRRLFVACVTEG